MNLYFQLSHPRHRTARLALLGATLSLTAIGLAAQIVPPPAAPAARGASASLPTASRMDADLFYQLLLGELNARSGQRSAGYAMILDAARKTNDPKLYARAVDMAIEARAGEDALQAARAKCWWR
jgi:hypothetical protein